MFMMVTDKGPHSVTNLFSSETTHCIVMKLHICIGLGL